MKKYFLKFIMLNFIALMNKQHGFVTEELNLGGGFGIKYTDNDDLEKLLRLICGDTFFDETV